MDREGFHISPFMFMDREGDFHDSPFMFMDGEGFHISPLCLWMGKISILVLYIFMDGEGFHISPLFL